MAGRSRNQQEQPEAREAQGDPVPDPGGEAAPGADERRQEQHGSGHEEPGEQWRCPPEVRAGKEQPAEQEVLHGADRHLRRAGRQPDPESGPERDHGTALDPQLPSVALTVGYLMPS